MEKGNCPKTDALTVMENVSMALSCGNVTKEMLDELKKQSRTILEVLKEASVKEQKKLKPQYLLFTLSMPKANSWNSKWSGEGSLYAKTISMKNVSDKRIEEILAKKNFRYKFDDGWVMQIEVTPINAVESKRIERESKGFCGYEWAITSIIQDLGIKTN